MKFKNQNEKKKTEKKFVKNTYPFLFNTKFVFFLRTKILEGKKI